MTRDIATIIWSLIAYDRYTRRKQNFKGENQKEKDCCDGEILSNNV